MANPPDTGLSIENTDRRACLQPATLPDTFDSPK
jgi:hypothetical protein